MATMRQALLKQLAGSIAMNDAFTIENVFDEVERRSKSGYFFEKEQVWWDNLSYHGQLRFMKDVKNAYAEEKAAWAAMRVKIAAMKAEDALQKTPCYEREAVEEIMAEESAENLRVIKENAAAIAEYDAWAALAPAPAPMQDAEQFVIRTDVTVIDLDGAKCVVWQMGKQETMTMFLTYQPIGGYWLPSAGNVFNKSSGLLWKMENRNWWRFEGATWDEAFKLAIDEYNGWKRESEAL